MNELPRAREKEFKLTSTCANPCMHLSTGILQEIMMRMIAHLLGLLLQLWGQHMHGL